MRSIFVATTILLSSLGLAACSGLGSQANLPSSAGYADATSGSSVPPVHGTNINISSEGVTSNGYDFSPWGNVSSGGPGADLNTGPHTMYMND